jgi:DNA-binding CsgD family transcriptional regulator
MEHTVEMEVSGIARGAAQPRIDQLTPRQLDVLELLCEGLSNKAISRRLNIAGGTVKIHVTNVIHTLQVSSRLQAVVEARRLGLVKRSVDPEQEPHDDHKEQRALDILRLILGEEGAARLIEASSKRPLMAGMG